MQTIADSLDLLKSQPGPWAERIISQLRYASELSRVDGQAYDDLIADAIAYLEASLSQDGVLTREAALEAERRIAGLNARAKQYRVICAAHAHIDMNWMWGYAETTAIVLDTFRTMLNLMNEYPDFKFSQSQASVYKIVEDYDPEMLEEIKARVHEGRWEITASMWVEADKNMPNGESFARHLLYTKDYLAHLFDIDPASLQIDFEPDTFGHSVNMPEILARGGVKYHYHCRGYEGHTIYRWVAPSGQSVIGYREPIGYNASGAAEPFLLAPSFLSGQGMDTMLRVYGVGDHGGGPTRRDLEKLIDMDTWPVFPRIRFGTFAEYFQTLDAHLDRLPVVNHELNFVFSGCYTTQTRIKMANRIGESRLNLAETAASLASVYTGSSYPGQLFREAWTKVLFNQFHDILTGSGVIETREYALGQFQQVLTAANSGYIKALRHVASQIDTSQLALPEEDIRQTISEGAGVGFSVSDFGIPQTERGSGKNRIVHFFNPSPVRRCEAVEISVWDWPVSPARILVKDASGNRVRHQVLSGKAQQLHPEGAFWGHKYMKLLIEADVPACGYSTVTLGESSLAANTFGIPEWSRVEQPDQVILENDKVTAVFDTRTFLLTSFVDKSSGREYVDAARPGGLFRLIEEDTARGMTSWIVGRHMNIDPLNRDVKIKDLSVGRDQLRQWVKYSIAFRSSSLEVAIYLDDHQAALEYRVTCDWHELPEKGVFIPQLNFQMPFAYHAAKYLYDVPFGVTARDAIDMDLPANSWALALPDEPAAGVKAIKITTDCKYGFRGTADALALTLIRSSYDPDPYPENGLQHFQFLVELADYADSASLINRAFDYNHGIGFVPGRKQVGCLPLEAGCLSLKSGSVAVSAIKVPEKQAGDLLLFRVYETAGTDTTAVMRVAGAVEAWLVDVHENSLAEGSVSVIGDQVSFPVAAASVVSVCVRIKTSNLQATGRIQENQLLVSVRLHAQDRCQTVDLGKIVPIGKIDASGGSADVSLSYDDAVYKSVSGADAGGQTARYLRFELAGQGPVQVSVHAGAGYVASRCNSWSDSLKQYDQWSGGDGIYTFNITNGLDSYDHAQGTRTLFFFGDTLVSQVDRATLARVGPVHMPNNTFATLDGDDPQKPGALNFHINRDEAGKPIAAIRPSKDCFDFIGRGEDPDKAYYWLQDGVVIGSTLYVMPSIITEDKSGPEGFQFRGLGVAIAEVAIKDGLPDFAHAVQHQTNLWVKNDQVTILYGAAILPYRKEAGYDEGDGYIYVYGQHVTTRTGRRCLCVARVLPGQFADDSQWRFFDGNDFVEDIWQSAPLLDHISCEMSVTPILKGKNRGKFLAVFQYDTKSDYTAYAIGESACGPFSEAQKVFHGDEGELDPSVYLYNAKAHSHLSSPDQILVSYNVNATSFEMHMKNGHIYRPRFITLEDTTIAAES